MTNEDIKILIVDDDEDNRFCAAHNLRRFIGYPNFAEAEDGFAGLSYLKENPDVDIILLDQMMTGLDGVEMLCKMKEEPRYNDIEVIFQTGSLSDDEKAACMKAGSLYLLQKPYDDAAMKRLLVSASQRVRAKRRLKEYLEQERLPCLGEQLHFSTLHEAEKVATQVAACFPQPEQALEAVYELLLNAIEHGNLELGYEAKKRALEADSYQKEVQEKLEIPVYQERRAWACVSKTQDGLLLDIQDQGKGIPEKFLKHFGPDCMSEPNGRGIFKATQFFDSMVVDKNPTLVRCLLKTN